MGRRAPGPAPTAADHLLRLGDLAEYSFCVRRLNTATVAVTAGTVYMQMPAGTFDTLDRARFAGREAVAGDDFVKDTGLGRVRIPVSGIWRFGMRLESSAQSTALPFTHLCTSSAETSGYAAAERGGFGAYYGGGLWTTWELPLVAGTYVQPGFMLGSNNIAGGAGGLTWFKGWLSQQFSSLTPAQAAWSGPEIILNGPNAMLTSDWNDAWGGAWIEPGPAGLGVNLTHVGFRLGGALEVVGGTGNLTVEVYVGTPSNVGSVAASFTVAAGLNSYVYPLPTAYLCGPGSVVRIKPTIGTATAKGPVHVHLRGQYAA